MREKLSPLAEAQFDFLVAGGGNEAERQSAGQIDLAFIQKRCGMAGTGENAGSIRIEDESDAGGESALHSAMKALVDVCQNAGRLQGKGRTGAHRSEERSEEHTSELQSLRHLVCRL